MVTDNVLRCGSAIFLIRNIEMVWFESEDDTINVRLVSGEEYEVASNATMEQFEDLLRDMYVSVRGELP